MSINISEVSSKMDEVINHLKNEFNKFRAGRANPDMIKGIKVMAYGSMMPIEQVANINVADPTLLTVQPWDKSLVSEVLKSIQSAGLGINPSADGELIRLPIPPLTSERRAEYVKMMKAKSEEAKISVRQKRKEFIDAVEKLSDSVSEDETKRHEKDIQTVVDATNVKIDEITAKKEKELLEV